MQGAEGAPDALIIGRFQPFHNGHMEVLRRIFGECRHVTIGIGSAQCSHTPENPFTAGERYTMIAEALRAEGYRDFYVVPVEDLNRYSLWVSQVVSMCPHFDVVYSNNPSTRRLFYEAGYEVRDSPLYNRSEFTGTEIRRRMLEREDWESLVPGKVAEVIGAIGGIDRIRQLGETDEPVGRP